MKKVKLGISAMLMLVAMLLSDRTEIFVLYALSAALHECGHLLAARILGIKIREVRFDFSGIRICTEEKLTSYRNEFLLAAAGPIVNYVVITVIAAFCSLYGVSITEATESCVSFLFEGRYSHMGALCFVALSSFLQLGINLLPIRTFDGGRMTYCLSAVLFGERRAEQILDVFSGFSAFVLWTVALYLMLRISSGLGIYVFSVCLFLSTLKKSDLYKGQKRSEDILKINAKI